MIYFHVPQCVFRHAAHDRVLRILHHGGSTTFLDGFQADGAIIECAGEDDTHDARTEVPRGGTKKRIDGRAVAVLSRPTHETNSITFETQVVIRRRDVHTTFQKL